jgi:hypothetical protein
MDNNDYKEIYSKVPENGFGSMHLMTVPAPFGIWSFEKTNETHRSKQELSDILGSTGAKRVVEVPEELE